MSESVKDATDEKLEKMFGRHKDGTPLKLQPNPSSHIKKMIGIVSGKGGVGKSFVTAGLACLMQRRGYRSAVLDGDITGPSQGKMFHIHEKLYSDGKMAYPAVSKSGIQIISSNMMLDSEDQPVIWRGPVVSGILQQFLQEVYWKDVDYMFVDMPPGTSDVPLTVFQQYPLDGILVVTSPQDLVAAIVAKAMNMAQMMQIRMLGIIENMSYVECDHCGNRLYIFGQSHVEETARKFQVPILARIPLRTAAADAADAGTIEDMEVPELEKVGDELEKICKVKHADDTAL